MSEINEDLEDDRDDLLAVLDRILVEARDLHEAKGWAFEALRARDAVVMA